MSYDHTKPYLPWHATNKNGNALASSHCFLLKLYIKYTLRISHPEHCWFAFGVIYEKKLFYFEGTTSFDHLHLPISSPLDTHFITVLSTGNVGCTNKFPIIIYLLSLCLDNGKYHVVVPKKTDCVCISWGGIGIYKPWVYQMHPINYY